MLPDEEIRDEALRLAQKAKLLREQEREKKRLAELEVRHHSFCHLASSEAQVVTTTAHITSTFISTAFCQEVSLGFIMSQRLKTEAVNILA